MFHKVLCLIRAEPLYRSLSNPNFRYQLNLGVFSGGTFAPEIETPSRDPTGHMTCLHELRGLYDHRELKEARANDAMLVTANMREFERDPSLHVEYRLLA